MANRRPVMKAMDALLEAGVKIDSVGPWCRDNGVNPRIYYRHRERIQAEGTWRERSRRQYRSPGASHPDLEAWNVKLRAEPGSTTGRTSSAMPFGMAAVPVSD